MSISHSSVLLYHSITTQPQCYNYFLTLYGIYSTVEPFDPPTQSTIIMHIHILETALLIIAHSLLNMHVIKELDTKIFTYSPICFLPPIFCAIMYARMCSTYLQFLKFSFNHL